MPAGDHDCPEPTALSVTPERRTGEAAQLLELVEAYWWQGFEGYCRYGIGMFSHAPLAVSTQRSEALNGSSAISVGIGRLLPQNMRHARRIEISGSTEAGNK